MEKTVVELFAGVGGFRCGLNKVELVKDKVKENGDWKFVWANPNQYYTSLPSCQYSSSS